jgi:glycosyltransferase 2 family protein
MTRITHKKSTMRSRLGIFGRHEDTNPDQRPSRSWVSFAAKLVLSAILLRWILRSVDPAVFWSTIFSADIKLFVVSTLMFIPVQLLSAYRWYFLLQKMNQQLSFGVVLRHNILGQFSSLFLPGQISGDIVRAISISNGKNRVLTYGVSVAIDKVALLASIALLALPGWFWSTNLSKFKEIYLFAMFLLLCCITIMFLFSHFKSQRDSSGYSNKLYSYAALLQQTLLTILSSWIKKTEYILPGYLQKTTNNIRDLKETLLPPRFIFVVLLLALSLQIVSTVGGFILAQSMGIDVNIIDWAVINAIVSIAQILPLSIGGLGIREGVFAGILSLYQVSASKATAFSLIGFTFFVLCVSCSWIVIEFIVAKKQQPKLT